MIGPTTAQNAIPIALAIAVVPLPDHLPLPDDLGDVVRQLWLLWLAPAIQMLCHLGAAFTLLSDCCCYRLLETAKAILG
jgi:hypothetical protein